MKIPSSILNLFLVASCVSAISSCGSDDPKKKYDIYLLGYTTPIDIATGKPRQVSYWKNGEEFKLGNGTTTIFPSSMAVDGDDVYVGGIEYIGNAQGLATYWKNGTAVRLSNGTKTEGVRGITVVDGVVYASGYESNGGNWIPKYWKNATPVILPAKDFASADDLVVIGNDVHVIGFESTADSVFARYWKNGNLVRIGPKTTYRLFTDIVSQGSDFFIAGYDDVGSTRPFSNIRCETF